MRKFEKPKITLDTIPDSVPGLTGGQSAFLFACDQNPQGTIIQWCDAAGVTSGEYLGWGTPETHRLGNMRFWAEMENRNRARGETIPGRAAEHQPRYQTAAAGNGAGHYARSAPTSVIAHDLQTDPMVIYNGNTGKSFREQLELQGGDFAGAATAAGVGEKTLLAWAGSPRLREELDGVAHAAGNKSASLYEHGMNLTRRDIARRREAAATKPAEKSRSF